MAKIKLMPIKEFVSELEAAVKRKDGYIMGSYGQNPRTGYLDLSVPESKCKSAWLPTGYYYKQYLEKDKYSTDKQYKQALKWRKECTRVWDCNGLAEGIYELFSGVCINSKARHNYAEWCAPKGEGMIPAERRVPGAAVFWSDSKASKIHHVAYLWKPVKEDHPEGDWYIIEAKGVMYGVVKSKLLSRKPNFWGWMTKYYDYSESPTPPEPTKKNVEITGNSVNVRSAPGTTGTRVLGVVHKGDKLPYHGVTKKVDGRDWYLVDYKNQNGWVSSKYARLI